MSDSSPSGSSSSQQLTGTRHRVDVAYNYLAGLFVVGVLVQVYLAGVGAFGINNVDITKAKSFDPHRAVGEILGLIAIIMLVLALIARRSRNVMIWTFVLALLVEVAQHGLAAGGDSNKWVGGLHAFDGLIILGLSGWLFHSGRGAGSRRGT